MKSVLLEEDRSRIRRTRSWINLLGQRYVAVRCPDCGSGGGQCLYSYQPKCHVCDHDVLMNPANHSGIVCDWNEAVTFYTELDNHLGNEIKS